MRNAWNIPDLRKKMLFTVLIIVLYRFGAVLPVPFISAELMRSLTSFTDGSIFQYFNILSGDAFSRATLFALSVSPYITASIVIQLLTIAIPALERLSKDGEAGKKKINQITRYVTVALALVTSYGYYMYIKSAVVATTESGIFEGAVIIACYCAGSALVMWLAEKINEYGIGNGISIILFANIVSSVPASFIRYVYSQSQTWAKIVVPLVIAVIAVLIITFVVFMTNAERRLPVQYAKKVVGRKMYGGQSTTLPIKLNMSGVMPIIFANAIVSLPTTIAILFDQPEKGEFWYNVLNFFSYTSPFYSVMTFVLIIAFAYFYIQISFDPIEVANNLKKNGGFILGIRPGKPTSDYIRKVLNKMTLIGAIFLGIIAVFPLVVNMCSGGTMSGIAFGGSSLLIVVGVILETIREVEAQMTMRHYKGFLE